MKLLAIATCIACTAIPTMAWADSQRISVVAPVISVSPIVRTVTDRIPHQSCFDERVRVEQRGGHGSPVPRVMGALIGGAVGSALGDNTGHQRAIATAGAVLGSVVAHDASQQKRTRYRYVTEERCEIDYELREREVVTGYRVGYEYGGEVYYTRTQQRPGPTLNLGVILEPDYQ